MYFFVPKFWHIKKLYYLCHTPIKITDMKKINDWIEIKRDKKGYITKECFNKMFDNALIIVTRSEYNRVYYEVIKRENLEEFKKKIEKDLRYTHYLPTA